MVSDVGRKIADSIREDPDYYRSFEEVNPVLAVSLFLVFDQVLRDLGEVGGFSIHLPSKIERRPQRGEEVLSQGWVEAFSATMASKITEFFLSVPNRQAKTFLKNVEKIRDWKEKKWEERQKREDARAAKAWRQREENGKDENI